MDGCRACELGNFSLSLSHVCEGGWLCCACCVTFLWLDGRKREEAEEGISQYRSVMFGRIHVMHVCCKAGTGSPYLG